MRSNKSGTKKANRRRPMRPRNSMPRGPSAGQSVYRGPTTLPVLVNPPTHVVQLNRQLTVSVTAGTTFAFAATNADPQSLPITEYASWAALYAEYRVLSVRAEYVPLFVNTNSNVATLGGGQPWLLAIVRGSTASTPPANFAALI